VTHNIRQVSTGFDESDFRDIVSMYLALDESIDTIL